MFNFIKNLFTGEVGSPADISKSTVIKEAKKHPDFKFDLGDEVKDTVTGYTGIIEYRMQWLTNCNCYGVLPRKLAPDGKIKDRQQIDEPRLELVRPKVVKENRLTGGNQDMPTESNRF